MADVRTPAADGPLKLKRRIGKSMRRLARNLRPGRRSAYHMALLTLISSLAQSIPLASMFAVYKRIVCRVQDSPWGPSLGAPSPPPPLGVGHCDDPWVAQRTSNYAASMATAGAVFALLVLARATALTERFGRKPLLLITLTILAVGYNVYAVAPLVPDAIVAAAVIFAAVIFLEAAQGIVLRTATQEYVVDTTRPEDRAGMLSFIEGVGQLGAFPGSTVGGYLPTLTGLFDAPFYTAALTFLVGMCYVLVCVPESKRSAEHHFWNDLQYETESEPSASRVTNPTSGSHFARNSWCDSDFHHHRPRLGSRDSTISADSRGSGVNDLDRNTSGWPSFLFPLVLVLGPSPRDKSKPDAAERKRMRWTRRHLALVIVLEESFQVFILPLLLLFNADVLRAGVKENGALISVLQGSRALFLVILFPWLIKHLRRSTARVLQRHAAEPDGAEPQEHSPLLGPTTTTPSSNGRYPRGHPIASDLENEPGHPSSNHNHHDARHRDEHVHWPAGRPPRRHEEAEQDLAPGEHEDHGGLLARGSAAPIRHKEEPPEQEPGALYAGMMILSYLSSCAAFLMIAASGSGRMPGLLGRHPFLVQSSALVLLEMGAGGTSLRTALFVNQSPRDIQAQALAASQMICALVYATAPLVLSGIYAWSLTAGAPGLVWIVKAGLALAAGLVSVPLYVFFLLFSPFSSASGAHMVWRECRGAAWMWAGGGTVADADDVAAWMDNRVLRGQAVGGLSITARRVGSLAFSFTLTVSLSLALAVPAVCGACALPRVRVRLVSRLPAVLPASRGSKDKKHVPRPAAGRCCWPRAIMVGHRYAGRSPMLLMEQGFSLSLISVCLSVSLLLRHPNVNSGVERACSGCGFQGREPRASTPTRPLHADRHRSRGHHSWGHHSVRLKTECGLTAG